MPPSAPAPSFGWEPPLPEELQAALPQYEITGILGRGGMGAVYKGRQTHLDRDIAIKVLPGELKAGEDPMNFAARFLREARAMARLSHPAIISVYAFGETAAGQLYFAMEFVDGMDLHHYIKHHGGKLAPETALAITAHVLDALDYAHRQGVVHRDIKPANILLNREGRVKIADFGLAKQFGATADPEAPALTMTDLAVGTPDYVAPEALDSDLTPDHRADLYAVGVMLYRMLAGKLPRGNFKMPSELDAGIDPRLDRLVEVAMASDPGERYASAAAMRADLDAALTAPLAKVEAGERSEAVAAAVPATSAVRAKREVLSRMPLRRRESASAPRAGSKSGPKNLLFAIRYAAALALVLALGLLAFALYHIQEDADLSEPPSLAESDAERRAAAELERTLALASAEEPYVNRLGMKFVPVPGTGTLFGVHEVRWKDYAAFVEEHPDFEGGWRDAHLRGPVELEGHEDHPVNYVSWFEARAFCAWLSEKEGLTYRLPSDREWSVAVGLGEIEPAAPGLAPADIERDETHYPWGLGWPPPPEAGNYSDQSRRERAPDAGSYLRDYDDGFPTTAPVMSFAPNALGLHDLGSNLLEWCEDRYAAGQEERTCRGAAFNHSGQTTLLSSNRFSFEPIARRSNTGFRVVLELAVPLRSGSPAAPDAKELEQRQAEITQATREAPFENSLGMKFVPVPGTEVLFCVHETRWGDFAAFAEENPQADTRWWGQSTDRYRTRERSEEHPVTVVNWYQAKAFCEWLSEREGIPYRLPSDREWSVAAGIGETETWDETTTPETVSKSGSMFPWGEEWPPPPGSGNFSDESRRQHAPREGTAYLDGYDDGFPTTAPVMSFAPNAFGLHDLGSNVHEWCEDWFSEEQDRRTARGGSWAGALRGHLLSSRRNRLTPETVLSHLGFRVVIELPASESGPDPEPAPAASAAAPVAPEGTPAPKASDPAPKATAKAESPAPPPDPASNPTAPADPAASPPPSEAEAPIVPPSPAAAASPSSIAERDQLLVSYLEARRARLGELAALYRRNLEARLGEAEGANDEPTARAYREEIAAIDALVKQLAETPAPLVDAPLRAPSLPPLGGSAPAALAGIRRTWEGESGWALVQLRGTLDAALEALVATLTRERRIDEAREIRAYREVLSQPPQEE